MYVVQGLFLYLKYLMHTVRDTPVHLAQSLSFHNHFLSLFQGHSSMPSHSAQLLSPREFIVSISSSALAPTYEHGMS